jgi:hypothetical protein
MFYNKLINKTFTEEFQSIIFIKMQVVDKNINEVCCERIKRLQQNKPKLYFKILLHFLKTFVFKSDNCCNINVHHSNIFEKVILTIS